MKAARRTRTFQPVVCAHCGSQFIPTSSANTECSEECAFLSRIDKTSHAGGCWLWVGTKNPRMYGVFTFRSLRVLAHRYALARLGMLPDGQHALHHCDNPSCVRAEVGDGSHLYAGTDADNSRDRTVRKRHPYAFGDRNGSRRHPESRPRGAAQHASKLTEMQAREIIARLAKGETQCSLAREFELSQPSVSVIARGKGWKHLDRSGGR